MYRKLYDNEVWDKRSWKYLEFQRMKHNIEPLNAQMMGRMLEEVGLGGE